MLKRYAEPERIRWTGKAWEIKNAIRVLERQKGGNARLKDVLPEMTLLRPVSKAREKGDGAWHYKPPTD